MLHFFMRAILTTHPDTTYHYLSYLIWLRLIPSWTVPSNVKKTSSVYPLQWTRLRTVFTPLFDISIKSLWQCPVLCPFIFLSSHELHKFFTDSSIIPTSRHSSPPNSTTIRVFCLSVHVLLTPSPVVSLTGPRYPLLPVPDSSYSYSKTFRIVMLITFYPV